MPRGYSIGTIRDSTHLTDDQWLEILHAMTAPCSVREISERAGIERHTAEVVRFKILAAISSLQENTMLQGPTQLHHFSVKSSGKGQKSGKKRIPGHFQALIVEDSNGKCIGMAALPGTVSVSYGYGSQCTITVSENVMQWLKEHNAAESSVADGDTETAIAWQRFIGPFKGIATKYLDEYIQWFCFLRNAEVIGKMKEDIVSDLWKLLNDAPQTVSNRSFRRRD